MYSIEYRLKTLFLTILFTALCAGFFSIIPISGLGVISYAFLFFTLFFLFSENQFKIKKSFSLFALAFFWLAILLVWKRLGTFSGLYTWFLGGLIVYSLSLFGETNYSSILTFLLITLALCILFTLFEICMGFHLPISRFVKSSLNLKSYFGLYIPSAYFTNENDLCGYLVTAFFLCRTMDLRHRCLYDTFLCPIIVFIIIIAGARLCIMAICVYYFYIYIQCFSKKKRTYIYVFCFTLLVVLSVKFILPYILQLQNVQSSKSVILRINLFIVALRNIFIQHNFIGLGPFSFPTIITTDAMTHGQIDPHNWFMELAIEAGMPFLILYIIFILNYLREEVHVNYKATFLVFLICHFCSSRFSGILWNWFFLAFFINRYSLIKYGRT